MVEFQNLQAEILVQNRVDGQGLLVGLVYCEGMTIIPARLFVYDARGTL
jgi:hypothetical protein